MATIGTVTRGAKAGGTLGIRCSKLPAGLLEGEVVIVLGGMHRDDAKRAVICSEKVEGRRRVMQALGECPHTCAEIAERTGRGGREPLNGGQLGSILRGLREVGLVELGPGRSARTSTYRLTRAGVWVQGSLLHEQRLLGPWHVQELAALEEADG